MLKKLTIIMISFIFLSCTQIDPFVFTKQLSPLHKQIKIFWSKDIKEVTLNNTVIKKQGIYYLIPKKYNISWKYKDIHDHEIIFKWKSTKLDIKNANELFFIKGEVTKK